MEIPGDGEGTPSPDQGPRFPNPIPPGVAEELAADEEAHAFLGEGSGEESERGGEEEAEAEEEEEVEEEGAVARSSQAASPAP